MYADPARIHKHQIKISLNDLQFDLVRAQANFRGDQLAVFVREKLIQALTHEFECAARESEMQRAG